jgi:hypothetical protein
MDGARKPIRSNYTSPNQGLDQLPKRGRAMNWSWPPSLIEEAQKTIEESSLIGTGAIKISGKLNLCN